MVVEAVLDLSDGLHWSAEQVQQTIDRLLANLPETKCDSPQSDEPLFKLARAFAVVGLKLQELAGLAASFSAVRATSQPGLIRVAIEFIADTVGQAAMATAGRLLQAASEGKTLSLEEDLRRLRDLVYDHKFRVSTAVIYHAARARGIPTARLSSEYDRFIRLGHGSKQHRCEQSETDDISAVARTTSTDKHLAKQLLAAAGVPVPVGRLVTSLEEAWAAASELGFPVAMKPKDTDLATGVSLDLRSREDVERGYHYAREHSRWILVEQFAPGLEHRVLVVGDRISAVTRIDPPQVVGDGVSTIRELAERFNADPLRGDEGSDPPKYRIKLDDVAEQVVAGQGYTFASVLPAGKAVLMRRNPPYFRNGGRLVDLTDQIHPSVAAHAIAAAQAMKIRVAGLDVVAVDISKPLEEQRGVIVEINAGPGLWLHLAPWAESPRPIGVDIVASMYPPGTDGRIPVIGIIGDETGTTATHLKALLASSGIRSGIAGKTEMVVGDRRWPHRAATPQERAELLMQNTMVDVAILETPPREVVSAGFGNDRCDVAVVLDPEPGEFADALRHALGANGVLVLSADGEPVETGLPASQVVLVSLNPDVPRLQQHRDAGGRVVVLSAGAILHAQGPETLREVGKCGEKAVRQATAFIAAVAARLVCCPDEPQG
jgi:cyanophycin synthetase